MKYLNSIYTPNMSGKQGNVVFSNNQYGPYSCMKRIPVDPKSDAQQTVRAGTARIARAWADLTPDQRKSWNLKADNYSFVKKGVTYTLSGFFFFMKINRILYEVNEPSLKDFPNKASEPQNIETFSVELVNTPGGKDLLLYIDPINDNTKIKLSATKLVKLTESYGSTKTHKIAVLDKTFVSGSSIKDYYIKKYKFLPDKNDKVFFDIKSVNLKTGFTTIPKSYEVYGF